MLRRVLALADGTGVIAGLYLGVYLSGPPKQALTEFLWSILTLPLWVVVFKSYGLYDRDAKRVSHSTVDDIPQIFHALVLGTLVLGLLSHANRGYELTLVQGATFFATALIVVFLARAVARRVARVTIPPQRVLFVGGGAMAGVLAQKIRQHPEYGLRPVGYVDADESSNLAQQMPHLGHVRDVSEICVEHSIDRLVIASPAVEESELADVVRTARALDLNISILPQMVDVLGPAVEIDDVEGITVLGLSPPSLTPSSRALKRSVDLLVAAPTLALALPLLTVIAIAVRLDSPGPALYSQERIGLHGRRFRIHKFRTMITEADLVAAELREQSAHPVWLLLAHDPRITRVGRVLRRFSLDELPQLWNVIRGHMSLVGPRPMPPDVDQHISGWGRRRLDLTPGVTGLWQVLGRTSIPFEEMVKLDYLYVTNWSLWQDIRLLIRTLPAVLGRRGAN